MEKRLSLIFANTIAIQVLLLFVMLFVFAIFSKPMQTVQPERYRACLIVKQDEVFCLSYERENAK